jgi:hypothetical protein
MEENKNNNMILICIVAIVAIVAIIILIVGVGKNNAQTNGVQLTTAGQATTSPGIKAGTGLGRAQLFTHDCHCKDGTVILRYLGGLESCESMCNSDHGGFALWTTYPPRSKKK